MASHGGEAGDRQMAKARTRYRTRVKTVYKKSRGGGGSMKPIIDGLMAGAGANLLSKYVNIPMADDLAILGVGYFRNNATLKTIGALGLGSDLVSMGLGGQTKNVYGGVY